MLCSNGKVYSFSHLREDVFADYTDGFSFGTAVYLSLSNRSQKNLTDIFEEYSDVENGFTKTRIPLKNVFETPPVSRSQAKRIGSRLEQFKDVEIDFDDIAYLGQGFAHEIFFVFANAHPEIKLTPLNTNETVKKMISHVSPRQQ